MDMQQIVEPVSVFMAKYGLRALGAMVVLVVGWLVAGQVRRAARRGLTRAQVDATLIPFLSGTIYYVLLVAVVIAVLNLLSVDATALVALLGAASLAVGLALQGTLSSFASGVMLLLFRPIRAGDYVEIGGASGSVVEVGAFSTTLKSPDNIKIVVPNSRIYGEIIRNYDGFPTRRIDLVVGIAYGDDIGVAVDTLQRILEADDRVLPDPEPVIAVSNLGDSAVELVVRPWCKGVDYWALRWDLVRRIKEEIEAVGCTIPFPQRDVHLIQAAPEPS
jgi:small conductance mechanosensitive channel